MGFLVTITTSRQFRNGQQLRDGGTTDLPGTTEDDCGEILLHEQCPA